MVGREETPHEVLGFAAEQVLGEVWVGAQGKLVVIRGGAIGGKWRSVGHGQHVDTT